MKELAVVLVSGGLDSCVTAAIAAQKYSLAFLHINYRQRTEKRELKAFHQIADFYKVKHRLIVDANFFSQIGGSSLTDEKIPVPPARFKKGIIPNTYVPFRNAYLLSVAVSWAEVVGASKIFIGAVEEDSSGYPDCRKKFYQAFNKLIVVGTKPETKISVVTPLIKIKKSKIVQKGLKLKAPLHLTWSCYQNNKVPCGICESCLLRLKGFQEAGVKDPIS
ncbi:MAG: 7-cyano-7-deazaguanine synthase QueC [Candidatus Edwardsbacteria bacterium]